MSSTQKPSDLIIQTLCKYISWSNGIKFNVLRITNLCQGRIKMAMLVPTVCWKLMCSNHFNVLTPWNSGCTPSTVLSPTVLVFLSTNLVASPFKVILLWLWSKRANFVAWPWVAVVASLRLSPSLSLVLFLESFLLRYFPLFFFTPTIIINPFSIPPPE